MGLDTFKVGDPGPGRATERERPGAATRVDPHQMSPKELAEQIRWCWRELEAEGFNMRVIRAEKGPTRFEFYKQQTVDL